MDETATTIHLAQLTGVVGSSILSGTHPIPSLPQQPVPLTAFPRRSDSKRIHHRDSGPDPRRSPSPPRDPPMGKTLRGRRHNRSSFRHLDRYIPRLPRGTIL
jgi:hypothetical protein